MLAQDGRVYMWGKNDRAQCGVTLSSKTQALFAPQLLDFESSHPVEYVECGDAHSALLTTSGALYTFGDNSMGQLGLGNGVFKSQTCVEKPTRVQDIFESIKQFSCGHKHTLALTR